MNGNTKGNGMKVVINKCHGGFGFSKEAYDYLGLEWDGYGFVGYFSKIYDVLFSEDEEYKKGLWCKDWYKLLRCHPKVIECVETLGEEVASGGGSELKVVEIPDGIEWFVNEVAGKEWIEEEHRIWE